MDLQTLQQEHEELLGELRGSTDRAKKASYEVKDNCDELRCYSSGDLTHVQLFEIMYSKWTA